MQQFNRLFPRGVIGIYLVLIGLLSLGYGADLNTPVTPQTSSLQLIAASDASFTYEGRIDFSNPAGAMILWQGSRISLDFEGKELALRFADAKDQNFFDVQIDDQPSVIVAVPAGANSRIEVPLPAQTGRHRLTLFKRSEAATGQVRFEGVEISKVSHAWKSAAPTYKLRMEFFGDSIMVGACNEDGATDQWDNRRTHNNALSYTALTAKAFAADYRCIAVSGMGIATGYVEVKAGEVWDRIYPVAGSKRVDLKSWQPDMAFINFGENDDSFSRNKQQPFPTGYTAGYVALIKAMRSAYPKTHFVILRGGMHGGSQSAPLREAWEKAVKEIEAADSKVSHYVFTHWSSNHPRVSDDRLLAEELITWLKSQAFMKRFL